MIKNLYIKNYAIIESLEMHFSKGLTIITGETGAGKSILLGALGLIMGKRAETKTAYNEAEKCVVEARFDIGQYNLKLFFEENDIDYDEDLVIRREITPSGKSRAFVNDTPANLKVLQELSSSLIDLHQQFDTLDINQSSFHLTAIDALADNKEILEQYQHNYQEYSLQKRQLASLREKSLQAAKETEFLQFQLEELVAADLKPDEQEALEQEQTVLNNAEDIKRIMAAAFQHLSESENSIISQLQDVELSVGNVKDFDSGIKEVYQRLESVTLELQDLVQDFERIADETEFNPERSQEVEDRLNLIYRLQTKNDVKSIGELLQLQQSLETQLEGFEDMSAKIKALEETIRQKEAILNKLAHELEERRKLVTEPFEGRVRHLLRNLAMEHAQLAVDIQHLPELGPAGKNEINFLFAANKGSRLQPIREVASGGELSRLALVIKSLVASAIPLPTLIFDEIDTGISGDVALKMGNILRMLSNEHQVVTITHSPQVAAKADVHYFVFKKVKEERTVTNVRMLSAEEQIKAIAVMLSQSPPSESALKNAKELVEQR